MKVRIAILAGAVLVLGCAAPGGSRLSYAEVQTLNPGVHADWCVAEYPCGSVTRAPDGRVQTIVYPVVDPAGRNQTLTLGFDANEILRSKRYSGPVIRPPQPKPDDAPAPCAPLSPGAPPTPFPQSR